MLGGLGAVIAAIAAVALLSPIWKLVTGTLTVVGLVAIYRHLPLLRAATWRDSPGPAVFVAILALITVYMIGSSVIHFAQPWVYEHTTSEKDKFVDDSLETTRTAEIWADNTKPLMYEDSEQYLRDHFKELNPYLPHQRLGNLDQVSVPKLVAESDSYSGRLIETRGYIRSFRKFDSGQFDQWLVQIQSFKEEDQRYTVYALMSTTKECQLQRAQPIVVEGLIVAAGTAKAEVGGTLNAVYMYTRDFIVKDKACVPPFILPD